MTLYKQLLTWMLAVFILLVTSVFVVEFNTTRQFLESQQMSEINNTVNSMGLALSPYLESDDTVAAESVINALFDGGYYKAVRLTMLRTGDEIIRTYPTAIEGVPAWFTNLDLFRTITDSRVLTSGWLQLAEVEIIGHPGYAYQQLWQAMKQLVTGFLFIFALTATMVSLLLSYALKPLKAITLKTRQITENQFGDPLPLPKTSDLVSVVKGINKMSSQLQLHFEEQAKEADRLRERAYQDPISGLGNRSYFMGQLKTWLAESGHGGMALLKVDHIQSLYENQGYQAGDNAIEKLANSLKIAVNMPEATIARLGEAEFAFLAPSISIEELQGLGENILYCVDELQPDPTGSAPLDAQIGLVFNTGHKEVGTLLSLADNALSQAGQTPSNPIALVQQSTDSQAIGKQQWKTIVMEAIANHQFNFKFQKVSDNKGSLIHSEVFTAISKNNTYYSAGQFLSAIEQLDQGEMFDRYVIEHMVKKLHNEDNIGPVAINLTQSSVTNPTFVRWLNHFLDHQSALASQIQFEIPESLFVNYADHAGLLCDVIRQRGFTFGVDNYGRHFHSLDYLTEFRPNYVKIDFVYTGELENEQQRNVLASISRTAHNLDITTIATRVETESQLTTLSEHFVNAFQGFIFEQKQMETSD